MGLFTYGSALLFINSDRHVELRVLEHCSTEILSNHLSKQKKERKKEN